MCHFRRTANHKKVVKWQKQVLQQTIPHVNNKRETITTAFSIRFKSTDFIFIIVCTLISKLYCYCSNLQRLTNFYTEKISTEGGRGVRRLTHFFGVYWVNWVRRDSWQLSFLLLKGIGFMVNKTVLTISKSLYLTLFKFAQKQYVNIMHRFYEAPSLAIHTGWNTE